MVAIKNLGKLLPKKTVNQNISYSTAAEEKWKSQKYFDLHEYLDYV